MALLALFKFDPVDVTERLYLYVTHAVSRDGIGEGGRNSLNERQLILWCQRSESREFSMQSWYWWELMSSTVKLSARHWNSRPCKIQKRERE
jgi:hypothetical protein